MIICVCVDRSIFTIKDDSILRLGAGTLSTSELCRTICDFEGPVRLLSGHRGYFLHSVWMGPKYSTPYHRKDSMDVSLFFNLSSLVLDDFKNISEGAQHWQE